MNDVKIEDLQALQDKIDERAKAEANRFLSDFIVSGSTYIDGFAEAAANKIDADLVCKGYQPICQSPRDFLAVCAAKDALTEKMSSIKVIFTGLATNTNPAGKDKKPRTTQMTAIPAKRVSPRY